MRASKRILLIVAVLLTIALLVSAGGWWMASGTPDWYHPSTLTDAQRAAAAQRAEDAWIAAQSRLAEAHARQATTQKLADGEPAPPVQVSFSAHELNAFFHKWSKLNGWDKRFEHYLDDPQIALQDGRLILGGRLKNVELLEGRVASIHFLPRINDRGELDLQLVQVLAGRLPMPDVAWEKQKQRLTEAVRTRLPALQQQAKLTSHGTANTEAVSATMGKLFLQIMNHQASEPVVFVPIAGRGSVPVRLTDVAVAPDAASDQPTEPRLTLTVEPMTPAQRQDFLHRLREPYTSATAAVQ